MAANFLREFLTSSDWEQMQELLEETAGASILWVISGSGRSAQRYDERYSEICELMRGSAEGLRRCRNSHHARSQEVKRTGRTKRLHPMNAYDRRLVHLTVREYEKLGSRSEGSGHLKRVKIYRKAPRAEA